MLAVVLWASVSSMALAAPGDILQMRRAIDRAFRVGDRQPWDVAVDAGDYIHLVIRQRNIDLAATVADPDGQTMATFDTPIGDLGPEHIRFIASMPGRYRIEL